MRGYAATTNQEIADGAGVTSAAMYQYFDSKKDLYIAAVRHAHDLIVPHFREAIETLDTAREGFHRLARAYVVAHERHPSVTPLLSALSVEMRRHPEIAEAMRLEPRYFAQVVIEIVRRGVERGEIDEADTEGVVSMIVACTMGLSAHAALMGTAQFQRAVDAFARLIDGNLLRAPGRRVTRKTARGKK